MTLRIETFVRPFQTPDLAPSQRRSVSGGTRTGGPQNIQVGGTPSTGAQLALVITSPALAGSPVTITFTLGGGDTLATAALGLVNAINANSNLAAAGITAGIVPTRPLELTVSQPTSLNPQATFQGSATGNLTITLASNTILIAPGRRGSGKVMHRSYDSRVTVYVHKIPQEMQAFAVPETLKEAIRFKLPPFFSGFSPP